MSSDCSASLTVPAEIESINTIADWVESCLPDCKGRFFIQLAVEELFTNIVKYGYEKQPLPVELRLGCEGESLWLELKDKGRPFDPTAQPDPRIDLPIEERPIGGLGIYLIKNQAQRFTWHREDDYNITRVWAARQ